MMGEVNIAGWYTERTQSETPPGYERRHGWKDRNGTWEALADPKPTNQVGEERRFSHKETKWRTVGRVADEAVVPEKSWKHDRGKGLCWSQASKET